VSNAEEDIFFLQNDIEELKAAKLESERRLKAELTEIQAEMAALSHTRGTVDSESLPGPADDDGADGGSNQRKSDVGGDSAELIQAMEEEIEQLTSRLAGTASFATTHLINHHYYPPT